jgi:hypothetical protein
MDGQPLGNGQAAHHGPAVAEDVQNLARAGALGKGKLTGFQRDIGLVKAGADTQYIFVADDAGALEQSGDGAGAMPAWDDQRAHRLQRARLAK